MLSDTTAPGPSQSLALQLPCCQTLQHQVLVSLWPCSFPAVRHYSTRSQSVFGPAASLLSDTTVPGPSQSLALQLPCCQTLQHQVLVSLWPCSFPAVRHYSTRSQSVFGPAASLLSDTTAPGPSQSLALQLPCCQTLQHQVPVSLWPCSFPAVRHYSTRSLSVFGPAASLLSDTTAPGPSQSLARQLPCCQTLQHQVPVSLWPGSFPAVRHYSTRSQSVFGPAASLLSDTTAPGPSQSGPAASLLSDTTAPGPSQSGPAASLLSDTTAPGPSQSLALQLPCCQTLQHQVPVSPWPCSFPAVRHYSTRSQSVFGPAASLLSDTTAPGPSQSGPAASLLSDTTAPGPSQSLALQLPCCQTLQHQVPVSLALQLPCCQTLQHQVPVSLWPCSFPAVRHYSTRFQSVWPCSFPAVRHYSTRSQSVWPCSFPAVRHYSTRSQSVFGPAASLLSDTTAPGPSQSLALQLPCCQTLQHQVPVSLWPCSFPAVRHYSTRSQSVFGPAASLLSDTTAPGPSQSGPAASLLSDTTAPGPSQSLALQLPCCQTLQHQVPVSLALQLPCCQTLQHQVPVSLALQLPCCQTLQHQVPVSPWPCSFPAVRHYSTRSQSVLGPAASLLSDTTAPGPSQSLALQLPCCQTLQHQVPVSLALQLPCCQTLQHQVPVSLWPCSFPAVRHYSTRSQSVWPCSFPAVRHYSTRSQSVFGPAASLLSDTTAPGPSQSGPAASLLSDTTAPGPSQSLALQLPCCQTLQHQVPVSLALQLPCCQTLQHQVPVSLALQLPCCQTLQHQVPVSLWPCSFPAVRHYSTRSQSVFGPAASLLSDTTAPGPSQSLALQLPCCQTLQHQVPVSLWPCSFPAVRHYSTRSQSVWPCSFPAVRHYSTRSQSVFGPAASLLSDTTAPGPSQSGPAASLLSDTTAPGPSQSGPAASLLSDTTAPGPSQSLALQLPCCQTLQHQVPVSPWPCSFPAVRHYSTRSQSVFGPAASLLSDTTAPGPSQSGPAASLLSDTTAPGPSQSLALQLPCCQTLQHQVPVSLALQLPCCQTLQHQVPVSLWPCSFPAVRHYSTRSQSVWPCSFPAVRHYSTRSQSVWPCSFPAVRHYSTRSQSVFGPAASLLSDTTAPGPSQSLALQLPCCQTLQHQVPVSLWPCSFPAVRHYSTRSQSVFGPAASLLSDTTAPGPSQSLALQLPCCQTLQHQVPVSLALQLPCCQTLQHQVPVSLALQLPCCQTLQHQVPVSLALQLPCCQTLQHQVPVSLALQLPCCQTLQHQVPVSPWPCSFPAVRHYSTRSQSVLGPAASLLSDTTAPGPSQSLALQLPCCQTLQHQVPVSLWPCSFPAVRHYSTRSQSVFGPAASLLSDTTAPGPSQSLALQLPCCQTLQHQVPVSLWPCSFPAVRHYSTRSQSVFGPAASLLSDTTAPGPSQSLARQLPCCQTLQHQVPVSLWPGSFPAVRHYSTRSQSVFGPAASLLSDTTAPGPSQSLALQLPCCQTLQHQVPVSPWPCSFPAVRHYSTRSQSVLGPAASLLSDTTAPGPSQSLALQLPCCQTLQHQVPVSPWPCSFPAVRHYSTRSQSVLGPAASLLSDTTAPGPSQSLALQLPCCQTLQHQVPVSLWPCSFPAVRHYSTRSQSVFGPAASLLSDTTAPGPSQSLALQLPCCQTLQHQVPVSLWPGSFPAVRHYSTRSQSVFGPAASLLSDTTAPGPSQSLARQLPCCQTLQHQVPVSLWPGSFPAVRHYSTRSQSVFGPAASLLSDTTAPGPSQSLALQLPCCQTLQHQVPVSPWPCSFPAVRHYSTRSQSVLGPAASLLSDTTAPGPSQSLALQLPCCQTLQHQVPVSPWPCSFPAVRHYSTRSQSVLGPAASLLSDTTAPGPSQSLALQLPCCQTQSAYAFICCFSQEPLWTQ